VPVTVKVYVNVEFGGMSGELICAAPDGTLVEVTVW
jgi:hypothetical protein